MTNSILITGDAIHDRHMYKGTGRHNSSLLSEGTHYQKTGGGALLLYGLVECYHKLAGKPDGLMNAEPRLGINPKASHRHGCGVFHAYSTGDEAGKRGVESKTVWRLKESLGYGDRALVNAVPETNNEVLEQHHFAWLLDDGGLDFRQRKAEVPGAAAGRKTTGADDQDNATVPEAIVNPAWPLALRKEGVDLPEWILLKTAAPLGGGDLWHALAPTATAKGVDTRFSERLIVVVSAADLRCESVAISEGISWERTALDVAAAIRDNPAVIRITRCRYLIVMFGVEGALLVDCRQADVKPCHLIFDPVHCEGDWATQIDGDAFGRLSSFVLGVLSRLPQKRSEDEPQQSSDDVEVSENSSTGIKADEELNAILAGMKAGLSAARTLLACGHGSADDNRVAPKFPLKEIAETVIQPPACDSFETTSVPVDAATGGMWRILEGPPARRLSRKALTLGQAKLVSQFGIEKLSGVPRFEMNALKTVDRHEIESLRNIKSLMEQYVAGKQSKPLSIGVFGQPGSGKSFGVKQIAKAVLGKDVPILEFNLSQLSLNEDSVLIGAFHQIRDRVLQGHVPVVFWDEFDAANLQWLSKLLAPMQDGAFLEGQSVRPIGRCIFIFAGGTSYDFASFGPPQYSTDELKALCAEHGYPYESIRQRFDEEHRHFKRQKGPDFKSRLTTYLNVAGPNPRKDYDWLRDEHTVVDSDTGYPLRRAVMLRGQAGLRGTTTFNIDPPLLTAFLEINVYRHGARSMEKILEQIKSRSQGGRMRLSHLPPDDILDLHVDADEFRGLLSRDLAFQRMAEVIAPHVHNSYLASAATVAAEIQRAFDDLDSEMRDENLAAAKRIPTVLAAAGLHLQQIEGTADVPQTIIDHIEAHIDVLAEAEHLGWMENRLRNGWTYNSQCTKPSGLRTKLRQHDCLVPYSQLKEEDKHLDRAQVRAYPGLAGQAGFEIQFVVK